MILTSPPSTWSAFEQAQYIIMCGIALNNKELIEHAVRMDLAVINSPVSISVLTMIDQIFAPAIGVRLTNRLVGGVE